MEKGDALILWRGAKVSLVKCLAVVVVVDGGVGGWRRVEWRSLLVKLKTWAP